MVMGMGERSAEALAQHLGWQGLSTGLSLARAVPEGWSLSPQRVDLTFISTTDSRARHSRRKGEYSTKAHIHLPAAQERASTLHPQDLICPAERLNNVLGPVGTPSLC